MNENLLEPLKYYEGQGKQQHRDNVEAHFQDLVKKSGVNVEENRATMEKWKAEQQQISALSKIISRFKLYRTLLIVAIVVSAILALVSIAVFYNSLKLGALLLGIGVVGILLSAIVIAKKMNPVIKNTDSVRQEHIKKANALESDGWEQMRALNNLFSDKDAVRLIEKTLPGFAFEDNFSTEQERLFLEKYDFYDMQTEDSSMLDTLAGQYAGNPFLFGRRRVHRMGTHTYVGSLLITWTETYRDSEGRLRTRTRSQTLTASVVKPKPYYDVNTFLAYGNQSAPNLQFSRSSKHVENLSEKALERKIKKGEQKLQKKAEKAIKNGGNFQEMANAEFDVLFDATNRTNEVEFRFMYTPLGQRNTVALLKDNKNYGDDFDFIKQGKCNVIISDHAQYWPMHIFAKEYAHFNFTEIQDRFISLNENYFKSVFFDFAPLFSVPAYLDEPCASLDDVEPYDTNYTYYEHEVMANALSDKSFLHEDSCTEAILKTKTLRSDNDNDVLSVTANSYTGIDRLDFIPTLGGDGKLHSVPVPWIEYVPVSKTTQIFVGNASTKHEKATVSYHGMVAGIMDKKD